jgi:gluconokinase
MKPLTEHPPGPVVLVLDVGSSSVRALLFDAAARHIDGAAARRAHAFTTDDDGASTADADALFALIDAVLDEVLAHPAARGVRAVALTTFVGSLVGLGEDGRPVTPAYTYADTRGGAWAARLRAALSGGAAAQRAREAAQRADETWQTAEAAAQRADETWQATDEAWQATDEAAQATDEAAQATGTRLHPAYWPVRMAWLAETAPGLFARAAAWADLGTAYLGRLFAGHLPGGRAPMSFSAAGWTGLLDRAALAWHGGLLDALRTCGASVTPAQLPALAEYDAVLTGLAPVWAARWPALRDVPFLLSVGDGAAANVGAGADTPGVLALTVGTTAAVRAVVSASAASAIPPVPDGLWAYRIDRARHLLGGATTEGGSVMAWARGALRLGDAPQFEAALAAAEPDAHGQTVLPLLGGERSPGWHPDAAGTLHGVRLSTSPFEIAQALLESVALRLAGIAERLHAVGQPHSRIIGGGGALDASPAWTQIMADAFDRPIVRLAEPETTARGAAVLALAALGLGEPPAPRVAHIVEPRPAAARALRQRRAAQDALYRMLYGG